MVNPVLAVVAGGTATLAIILFWEHSWLCVIFALISAAYFVWANDDRW